MHPVPCAHCGTNFMRKTLDPETPRLCNNCIVREKIRNNKQGDDMEHVIKIVIECPSDIQKDIEEYCINQGMDFTKYFLSLHHFFKEKTDAYIPEIKEEKLEEEKILPKKNKGNKK